MPIELVRCEETLATSAAFGTQTGPALDFAGLFVEFADAHLFLDAAAFDQLAETADGFLGRFLVTER